MDTEKLKADAAANAAKFKDWAGVGDHRWWIAVAAAFALGILARSCAG